MRPFMDEEFLLTTDTAKRLFHGTAEKLPIIDYHCHLSPKEIAEDKRFGNITELFLGGDHYKWRLMAFAGTDEALVRGNGGDYEKFLAYAKALSGAIGNPLYHWTHLELKRVFGIGTPLTEKTAPEIWEKANEMLARPEFSARALIHRFNVETLCTTDDPADDLRWHEMIAADAAFPVKVLPTFRPDKAVNIENAGFADYIAALGAAAGMTIDSFSALTEALEKRVRYFDAHGAKLSDHSFHPVPLGQPDEKAADAALRKALSGETLTAAERDAYKMTLLTALGGLYSRFDWTQQYHLNALRNPNERAFRAMGPDTGFDAMRDDTLSGAVAGLLNAQAAKEALPRTILYSLNPNSMDALMTVAGSFSAPGVRGNVQYGSAWWFMDRLDGMRAQLTAFAGTAQLQSFIGMLTDSRSFVSYPRHEYFRRILCGLIGEWVEEGLYPDDEEKLSEIVSDICCENARRYFRF